MNINKEMRLRQWAQDMAEQQASGLTQKQWCDIEYSRAAEPPVRCGGSHQSGQTEPPWFIAISLLQDLIRRLPSWRCLWKGPHFPV